MVGLEHEADMIAPQLGELFRPQVCCCLPADLNDAPGRREDLSFNFLFPRSVSKVLIIRSFNSAPLACCRIWTRNIKGLALPAIIICVTGSLMWMQFGLVITPPTCRSCPASLGSSTAPSTTPTATSSSHQLHAQLVPARPQRRPRRRRRCQRQHHQDHGDHGIVSRPARRLTLRLRVRLALERAP
jgi:hypothetical protein